MTRSMDTRRTGLGCAAEQAMLNGGEYASRMGRGVCRWVNEMIPGAAEVVITAAMAPGLIYNIPAGRRLMLSQYCIAIETTGDDCQFELGYTDQVDGAGTFTPMMPHKHVFTGAANQGLIDYEQPITPAEPVSYAAGARCITFRVDANDAACEITVGWHGWWGTE
jgi:hypothetical protein